MAELLGSDRIRGELPHTPTPLHQLEKIPGIDDGLLAVIQCGDEIRVTGEPDRITGADRHTVTTIETSHPLTGLGGMSDLHANVPADTDGCTGRTADTLGQVDDEMGFHEREIVTGPN